jgi:cytochrome c oxidase subunit 2
MESGMQLRRSLSARRLTDVLRVVAIVCTSLIGARSLGPLLGLGPLSQHMLDHIALLGVAAPLSAWVLRTDLPQVTGQALAAAAALQIAMIWIWHLPPVFSASHASGSAFSIMTVSLFLAGLVFWCAIVGVAQRERWQAILGLLITGKLFCLFAAVLVFSPRLLYDLATTPRPHAHHGVQAAFSGLADQQLAGLIMIAVCPLTYVAAGIAIAARWFAALELAHPDRSRAAVLRSPALVASLAILLSGLRGAQSTLAPASLESEAALSLSWLLFIGGTAIFVLVMTLVGLAALGSNTVRARLAGDEAIVIGGVAFPAVVLSALLGYGLWLASADAAATRDKAQEISVQGERWWWRVTYQGTDARGLASANEIRLSAGRPVRLSLTSPDVIHSFWVPALSGKVDLIPGRTNVLTFTPTKTGTYRGQCAEYCGGPHALMGLRVVVMEPEAHAEWLVAERRPAQPLAENAHLARGRDVFMTACVACHAVRGTDAVGRLGPDLTHVASRGAIGAEVLPMNEQNLARWLVENERLKPNNLMPEFHHLADDDRSAVAAYVASLK